MLGDEDEKKPNNTLNPLKIARRRRNAKTVQFTAPSYVEPSDVEYSSDEDDEGNSEMFGEEQDNAAAQQNDQSKEVEQSSVVEPLRPWGQTREVRRNGEITDTNMQSGGINQVAPAEDVRESDEIHDRSGKATIVK